MRIFISGDLTYWVELKCKNCGKLGLSKHRMRAESISLDIFRKLVEADYNTKTPDIPVGWSMAGKDNITCETCKLRGRM